MPYRPRRSTRAERLSAALFRVADAAALNLPDLQNPPEGFRMSVRIARAAGGSWTDIAGLTPYTPTELQEMDEDGTFQPGH
jgi:hypothetical protein